MAEEKFSTNRTYNLDELKTKKVNLRVIENSLFPDDDDDLMSREADYGFEIQLVEEAKVKRKVLSLETYDSFHRHLYAPLSELEKKEILFSLKNPEEFSKKRTKDFIEKINFMYKAFEENDLTALENYRKEEIKKKHPEYIQLFYDYRNSVMVQSILSFLNEDSEFKTYFAMCGCLHLLGKNGIIDLLNKVSDVTMEPVDITQSTL